MVQGPASLAPPAALRLRFQHLVVAAVTLAALVVALVRLPAATRLFDDRAQVNSDQTATERLIAGADGVDIDNEFLIRAMALVPAGATYVLGMPDSEEVAAQYGIVPTTLLALRGYVRFLMLPRREADPAIADYLLCYACDTAPFDPRMHRLWTDPKGFVIGKLRS
jgi:hypothetical protein